MKITIWPRNYFYASLAEAGINDDTVSQHPEAAFISIQSTPAIERGKEPYFKKQHPNALTLVFDDLTDKDTDVLEQYRGSRLFDENDAQTVIDFVRSNVRANNDRNFILHCTAGISRSGAVGEFIQRVLGVPYGSFHQWNPNIRPNIYVLNTLMRVYQEQIDAHPYNEII